MEDKMNEKLIEQLEDEMDLQAYKRAMEEFQKDPVTYTQKEMLQKLGLTEAELDAFIEEHKELMK
jgi:hypothetical protein